MEGFSNLLFPFARFIGGHTFVIFPQANSISCSLYVRIGYFESHFKSPRYALIEIMSGSRIEVDMNSFVVAIEAFQTAGRDSAGWGFRVQEPKRRGF